MEIPDDVNGRLGRLRADVPTVFRDEPGTGEKMPDWFSRADMTDGWANIFESEAGEKGWIDCPP